MQRNSDGPAISLLVPTYGRPDKAHALLERLKGQTAPAGSFEVVLVDDGSVPAIAAPDGPLPFELKLLRQENRGPAAARNHGLEHVRAELVLILNDDCVPADDLVEKHLAAHAELDGNVAVLGTFGFTSRALESPFTRLLEGSKLLFAYPALQHGGSYGWDTFWTCNISLRTASVREAGGFDAERFDRAICEDVELGVRLCGAGLRVVFREDCVAEHEHRMDPLEYMDRAFILGIYQCRLGVKFDQAPLLFPPNAFADDGGPGLGLRPTVHRLESAAIEALGALLELEEVYDGRPMPYETVADAREVTLQHSQYFRLAGLYFELTGEDLRPSAVLERLRAQRDAKTPAAKSVAAAAATSVAAAAGPAAPRAQQPVSAAPVAAPSQAMHLAERGPDAPELSIVVVSCNALDNTRRCIDSLRAAADERFPQEILVIDNGSTDGSAEWLAGQDGVTLIRNPANHGAPRARNQGILRARGAWVAFFDNDVVVPRGWIPRTLEHARGAADVGSIPLCANRASKQQVVAYDGDDDTASIERFANLHYGQNAGEGADATLFTSLAVVVRREVIERIGGFDETFSPWGFEDDDYALRIRLAGWRNRVARDSFVYHAHYKTQEKHERHAGWLQSNWDAFLAKWCPQRRGAQLFDYDGVTVPTPEKVTESQLAFALPDPEAAPPTWDGCEHATLRPAPRPQERTGSPELTVLLRTQGGPEALERSLASLEQQTAAGRYEIVVVLDGSPDGTASMLDTRAQGAPTKVVHGTGSGAAAARNSGLRVARGTYVLFVEDGAVAAPDLVERHLAAHTEHGPQHAVLGRALRRREDLGTALMRVLEDQALDDSAAPMARGERHDWTRLSTDNLSVALDDLRAIGLFDEEFQDGGCGDCDLGYRLESERGTTLVFEPQAQVTLTGAITLDELIERDRKTARAFVNLFVKHPELLTREEWRAQAEHTLEAHEQRLAASTADRATAEVTARALAEIDVGALERSGGSCSEIALEVLATLRVHLDVLGELWWAEGESEGMRAFGIESMSEAFRAARRRAAAATVQAASGPAQPTAGTAY